LAFGLTRGLYVLVRMLLSPKESHAGMAVEVDEERISAFKIVLPSGATIKAVEDAKDICCPSMLMIIPRSDGVSDGGLWNGRP